MTPTRCATVRDFSIAVDVAASAERIWQVLTDIERWSEWTPSVLRIDPLSAPPLGPGSRARIHQPGLRPAVWVVTGWEPYRRFSWTARHPGVAVVGDHVITAGPRGCRVELAIRFNGALGALVGRLTERLTTRNLELESTGLKARSQAPAHQ